MHRLVKANTGIVAVRDLALQTIVGETPATKKYSDMFEAITRDRGADLYADRINHIWAREAGISCDRISTTSVAFEYHTAEDKYMWASLIEHSMTSAALRGEYAMAEELNQAGQDWMDWSTKQESKLMIMDGCVLGWK
jgi:hypothetical protein